MWRTFMTEKDTTHLLAVARAYTNCVELEDQARLTGSEKTKDLTGLRENLQALLIEALREARVSFQDEADASRLAFEIVNYSRSSS